MTMLFLYLNTVVKSTWNLSPSAFRHYIMCIFTCVFQTLFYSTVAVVKNQSDSALTRKMPSESADIHRGQCQTTYSRERGVRLIPQHLIGSSLAHASCKSTVNCFCTFCIILQIKMYRTSSHKSATSIKTSQATSTEQWSEMQCCYKGKLFDKGKREN